MKTILNGLKLHNIPTTKVQSKTSCSLLSNPMFLLHVSDISYLGSSDGTLQIVDMRTNLYKKSQLKINAHKKDVNVFDWNKTASHLIVTGSDDCKVKVWDLRMAS